MNDKLLSSKVLAALQYRLGDNRPNNDVVDAAEGKWLVVKGTTGVLQELPNGTIQNFKSRLRMFTHLLAGHYDDWSLTRHPLPEPETTDEEAASDLGIANAKAFSFEVAMVKDGEGWKVEMSDGSKVAANEIRSTYHEWVNWFIKGHSIALHIPQFTNHAAYMKAVDETLHTPKDEIWAKYEQRIEERQIAKEVYKTQKPFLQNDRGGEVGAQPKNAKAPVWTVVALDGSPLDMAKETVGKEFGVYANGSFMFPIKWDPEDKTVMAGWNNLFNNKYLRVGDPQ